MAKREWFVIKHCDGKFSVQDRPTGAGILLNVNFDNTSEREATLVCAAANDALAVERTSPATE